ncbi:MAG: RNA polymerase sigma factor [Chloroflexi bacterium]|nr:RNA polymerase sigma factor [Chloroflexota bacterium]
MDEDTILLDRARALDPQALGQIYDAYFERLYRYAYHFVDSPEAAQDIAAETLRRLLEVLHKGQSPQHLSVWLYRVAHNLAIDIIRRHPPGTVVSLDAGLDHVDLTETENVTEARMMRTQVRAALAGLTPDQQNVVVLKFLEGYSNAEIGELINKPEGAVKSLQHRALAALRRALNSVAIAGIITYTWNVDATIKRGLN